MFIIKFRFSPVFHPQIMEKKTPKHLEQQQEEWDKSFDRLLAIFTMTVIIMFISLIGVSAIYFVFDF